MQKHQNLADKKLDSKGVELFLENKLESDVTQLIKYKLIIKR